MTNLHSTRSSSATRFFPQRANQCQVEPPTGVVRVPAVHYQYIDSLISEDLHRLHAANPFVHYLKHEWKYDEAK